MVGGRSRGRGGGGISSMHSSPGPARSPSGLSVRGQWLDLRHFSLSGVSMATNTNSPPPHCPREVGGHSEGLPSGMRDSGAGKFRGFSASPPVSSPDHGGEHRSSPHLLPTPQRGCGPHHQDSQPAAGKTPGRLQEALLTLCPASLSTLAATSPATPAPTTITLWGFEVRLRPKVTTLSSTS